MTYRILTPAGPRWTELVLSVLRIVAALVLMQHGTQKFFDFPVPGGPPHPYVLFSLPGIAAILETFGGLAMLIGFLTRPIAFLLSGEMAVAYFTMHAPHGFWPLANHGEVPVLLCFIFFYLIFAGPGSWSIDAIINRRVGTQTAERPRPTSASARP